MSTVDRQISAATPDLDYKKNNLKFTKSDDQRKLFLITLISGAIGGYLSFPFEGIKKRLQRGELDRLDLYKLYNGKFLRVLYPRELFRGSSAFATSVTIASTASITLNSYLKKNPSYDEKSKGSALGAAIASGMIGSLIGSTPVENTIFIQQEKNVGPLKAINIMLKQGITRPWVGARELMFREGGFAGVMLWGGPASHGYVKQKTDSEALAVVGELFAGAVGALLTHPADTLATERQKFDGKISLLSGIKRLYQKDGIHAFYKGAAFRIGLFTICSLTIPRFVNILNQGLNNNS